MLPNDLVGKLGLIPPPNEQLPGTVATAVVLGRRGEALLEKLQGGLELGLALHSGQGALDELALDATPVQVALDPLRAPAIERPAVLDELPRVAGVVEKTGLLELRYRLVDLSRSHPPSLETATQLGDGVRSPTKRLVGELDRPLAIGLGGGRRPLQLVVPSEMTIVTRRARTKRGRGREWRRCRSIGERADAPRRRFAAAERGRN